MNEQKKTIKRSKFVARIKEYTPQEKFVLPVAHIVLLVIAIWMLLPVIFALINSVKTVDEYYKDSMAMPTVWKWSNYKLAIGFEYRNVGIIEMFFNSVIMVMTFSFGTLASSIMTAYALAKFKFPGRNFLYALAVTVQIIPIFGTTGAGYLLMDALGFIDNIWLIWLSGASGFNYTFLIMHSYFDGVDRTYSEAAEIDGAGNWRIMLQISIPMILPAVLTMWLSNFVALWNDYTTALIYLPNNPTLATGLYNLKSLASYTEGGITSYFAALMISMVPVLIIFSFTQKKIFSIDVSGGVKG